MKRLIAGTGALLVGVAMLVSAGPAAAGQAPRAQLRGFACVDGLNPTNRSVAVTAQMRPVTGTRHMQLRFYLLATVPGHNQTAIRAGDLGTWINPSNPTLGQLPGDVWNLQKLAVPLAAPAVYRFRVQYRWLGAHNRVLATTERFSPRCRERELRPDLQVESITVTALPNHPDKDLYTALIADDGKTGAGPFDVLFAPGNGSPTTTRTVPHLAAHSTKMLNFVGPLCSTGAPTVTVDSALQVDDYNRANNQLTATCPAPTTS